MSEPTEESYESPAVASLDDHRRKIGNKTKPAGPLKPTGGDGTSGGMETRVTRLEEWAKVSDERLGRIETKIDGVALTLGKLPSRAEAIGYAVGGIAVAAAIVAIIVGAMGWLETRAARLGPPTPVPIIFQLPAAAAPLPAAPIPHTK